MHNLALALHQQGHHVTGSDDLIHEPSLSRLREAGLLPAELGWHPERIVPELHTVIVGMHAHADNPELARARELDLLVLSFPEFVFSQCRHKQRIVVAGSHGKTTTTSAILHALRETGHDTDYLVGAQIQGFDTMVRLTEEAPVVVIEGDEYPTSPLDPRPKFLHYEPHLLLLTGVAWDHINAFPTREAYDQAFRQLLQSLPKGAAVVYNHDDKHLRHLVNEQVPKTSVYLYPYEVPKYRYRDNRTEVKLGKAWAPVYLYGDHNLSNLAGAVEVLKLLAFDAAEAWAALSEFRGAGMRMEHVLETSRLVVIRDFAHAPSKVTATTEAVAERFKSRNLVTVLELNTYSSLNSGYLPEYRNALRGVKAPVVYISAETLAVKRLAMPSEAFLRRAFHQKDLVLVTQPEELKKQIRQRLSGHNDVLLLMSSGGFSGATWQELAGV
jgi:UDP-N-acetylmuramate: L-alanyl-gamma-D-glutamyl-meso-diaminopimelate ligase